MVLLVTKSNLALQLAAVDENGMALDEAQFKRYAIPADVLPAAQQIKASALHHYQPPARYVLARPRPALAAAAQSLPASVG
jgi:hypothetical protein